MEPIDGPDGVEGEPPEEAYAAVAEPASPVARPRRRRSRQFALAAAVVLLAAAGVALAVRAHGGDARVTEPAAADPLAGGWCTFAAAPLSARDDAVAVWTGREVVVWGGHRGIEALSDGAAYDPVTDTWRTITPNQWAHPGASAVWTGSRVVVLAKAGGAAYDPVGNDWTELPRLEVSPGSGAGLQHAVWTGSALLGIGPQRSPEGVNQVGVATLTPDAPGWRIGATLDVAIDDTARVVWAGGRAIVWPAAASGGLVGYAYDPTSDRWAPLPPVAAPAGWSVASVLPVGAGAGGAPDTGATTPTSDSGVDAPITVVMTLTPASGPATPGPSADPTAAAPSATASAVARLEGDTWVVSDPSPGFGGGTQAVARGGLVVVFGAGTTEDGTLADGPSADPAPVAVDLHTGLWRRLGAYPLASASGRSIVWADDLLFVWGGHAAREDDPPSGAVEEKGAQWRPASGS